MFSRAEADRAAAQLACLRQLTSNTNNVTWATLNDVASNAKEVFSTGVHYNPTTGVRERENEDEGADGGVGMGVVSRNSGTRLLGAPANGTGNSSATHNQIHQKQNSDSRV